MRENMFTTSEYIVSKIQPLLCKSLLKPKYRKLQDEGAHKYTGHCYVASEALFYIMGGKYRPYFIRHEGEPHWFLKHVDTGEIVDATADQFKTPIPYDVLSRISNGDTR